MNYKRLSSSIFSVLTAICFFVFSLYFGKTSLAVPLYTNAYETVYPDKPYPIVYDAYSDTYTKIDWQDCKNIADPYYCQIFKKGQSDDEMPYLQQMPEVSYAEFYHIPAGEYYAKVVSCNHFDLTVTDSDPIYFTVKEHSVDLNISDSSENNNEFKNVIRITGNKAHINILTCYYPAQYFNIVFDEDLRNSDFSGANEEDGRIYFEINKTVSSDDYLTRSFRLEKKSNTSIPVGVYSASVSLGYTIDNHENHIEKDFKINVLTPGLITTTTTTTSTTTTTTTSTTTTTTLPEMIVDQNNLTLYNGDQHNIVVNRKNVTYKTNNSNVAIVSSKGVITAIGVGTATISVIDTESDVVQIKVTVLPVNTTTSTTTTQKPTTTTTTSTTTTQKPTTTTTTSTTTTQKPISTTTTSTTTTQKPTTTTTTSTTTTQKPISTTTTSTTTTQKPTTTTMQETIILTNGYQHALEIHESNLTFKSNNHNVAVVSKDGIITAIGEGEAIISIIDSEYNVHQIKVNVQPVKTTTTTTTYTTTITTTTTPISQKYTLGDVNNNGTIDAVDASTVLAYYAMISTNKDGGFDDYQKTAADVDHDGKINAVDASNILSYYAYVSTTKEEVMSMEEFMKKK